MGIYDTLLDLKGAFNEEGEKTTTLQPVGMARTLLSFITEVHTSYSIKSVYPVI